MATILPAMETRLSPDGQRDWLSRLLQSLFKGTILMKIRHAVALSSIVFGTAFAGIASASISTGSLGTDVQSAIGSGTVTVFLSDGVATLVGNVEARTDSIAAESAALNFSDVDSVINHISVN